jgi:hypothetical protein
MLASTKQKDCYGSAPATTFRLKYQYEYGTEAVNEDERAETKNDHRNHTQPADKSFESASSFILMERIVELETALRETDLDPEESEKFLVSLQSRISKLKARGYEKIGSVDATEEHR